MKYALTVSGCGQVGINEWRDWHKTAIFDESATISQINSWVRLNAGEKCDITDTKISSLEDKSP